jgi:hypothetical protein
VTRKPLAPLPLENVRPDAPLRLDVAAALAFPDGSMTASGLRREASKGRLRIERVASKDYTTLYEIEQMRRLCRVEEKAPGSGSSRQDESAMAASSKTPSGRSATATSSDVLASARARIKALSKTPSPNTSAPSGKSRASATVVRLRS